MLVRETHLLRITVILRGVDHGKAFLKGSSLLVMIVIYKRIVIIKVIGTRIADSYSKKELLAEYILPSQYMTPTPRINSFHRKKLSPQELTVIIIKDCHHMKGLS